MILPFLDRVGCGIVVDEASVRFVEVAVRRGRARVVRTGEAVGDDALQTIWTRARPARPFAALAVDVPPLPGACRLRPPDLEHADDLRAWTAAQVGIQSGLDEETLAGDSTWQAVQSDPDAPLLAAPVVRADFVAQSVEANGISVGRVGHAGLEAWASLTLTGEPVSGPILYASGTYGAWVDIVEGYIEQAGTGGLAEALDSVAQLSGGRQVTVTGPEAEGAAQDYLDLYALPVQVGIPLAGVAGGDLHPAFAAAAGLAVADLYTAIPAFDVLPAGSAYAARKRLARWASARTLLVSCSVLLVLLGGLRAAQYAASLEAERSAERLAGQDDAAERLAQVQDEIASRRAVGSAPERTDAALAFGRVANALPEGVWLSSFEWESGDLAFEALSTDAVGVEASLSAYEGVLDRVRLGGVQRVDGPPPLYRFSVSAHAPPDR